MRFTTIAMGFMVFALAAGSAHAQGGGPTIQGATVGVQVAAPEPALPPAPVHFPPRTRAGRLMVFGGATFVVGAVVGGPPGSILMLAGAGIGLYGFWLYLH